MATIFSAPTIGDPRAVGIKNGGISKFETDIVRPMTRLSTDDDTWAAGKQLEFRFRSDSSRFFSPKDSRLYVKYKLEFGQPVGGGTTVPLDLSTAADADKVKSVRVTAAPNTVLFDGGVRYLQNNVMVEHNPHPYTAAMAQLLTKSDIPGTDTGSAGLLSLRKDVNKSVSTRFQGGGTVFSQATTSIDNDYGTSDPEEFAVATTAAVSGNTTLRGLSRAAAYTRSTQGVRVIGFHTDMGTAGGRYFKDTSFIDASDPTNGQLALRLGRGGGSDYVEADLGHFTQGTRVRMHVPFLNDGMLDCVINQFFDGMIAEVHSLNAAALEVDGTTAIFELRLNIGNISNLGKYNGVQVFQLTDLLATSFSVHLDLHLPTADDIPLSLLGEMLREGDNKPDNVNPKQEILTAGAGSFEYSQPLFLASFQHGYAVGPSDHQLFLTISNYWKDDLLHCPKIGNAVRAYNATVAATSASAPTDSLTAGSVRIAIEEVELHVAYVTPTQTFIPPSQSLRFSEFTVDTRVPTSGNVQESLVVNPGIRQVLFGMRQDEHGIHMDREEFGLAMAGIDEAGTGGTMTTFTDFQLQIGGTVAPTVAFSRMSPAKAHMARVYQEFLNVIGKPLAMRGNTLTYAEYIGAHNSNSPSGPGKGDHGPIIALRLLTPESELTNELQVRGTLSGEYDTVSKQQMVIISVADRLLDIAYAPPQELPVSTTVNNLL
jgi:hypothetical protein